MKTYTIKAEWDDEASVWYVAESDVPGLCTEAPTAEDLIKKLKVMIPELVALNCEGDFSSVPFELIAHRTENYSHCHYWAAASRRT